MLRWIIESNKCDIGTAVRVFWMAAPDYYFAFNFKTIDDFEKDIFKLLQLIITKLRNNAFKTSRYKFIPQE